MTAGSKLPDSVDSALADTGLPVYPNADTVPDGAPMPCILLNIESDELVDHVGVKAKRSRSYSITVAYLLVHGKLPTEAELNGAVRGILSALGFGLSPFERPIRGMHTTDQETRYEFAGKGSNFTTADVVVTFDYIETY